MNEYSQEENKPIIEISENVFKMTLPNRNYKENKIIKVKRSSNEDKILNYLEENDRINRENVEELLDLSKSGARKVINNLIEENLIETNGRGKNTYYVLK